MRNICFILLMAFFSIHSATAQKETWNFQNYAIGNMMTGDAYTNECGMPEIIQIGSTYYMYFGTGPGGSCQIKYATSPDLISWKVQGTVLTSSSVPTNREYHIGGPRVVKLSTGQYRMFYRACQNYTTDPPYHCLSAISNDGITFTRETGTRIEIKPHLPNSYFKRVAHSAFYKDAVGNVRAVLTGADTTMAPGPDRLYTAVSFDEGLTWSNFTPLFNNGHDPMVVKEGSGLYHLYFSYLILGFRKATSTDGITWTNPADTVYFKQGSSFLTESSSPNSIADLGGYTNASGNVILFSAYKTAIGPWTNIAYYTKATTSIADNSYQQDDITVYPNPFSTSFTVKTSIFLNNAVITLSNALGQTVQRIENINGQSVTLQREGLPAGMYFLYIRERYTNIAVRKVMILD